MDDDVDTTLSIVAPAVARELAGSRRPTPIEVHVALKRALGDVITTTGWGFATARRPHAPDVELVKLVRGGTKPQIAWTPRRGQGHLLYMRTSGDGRWQLVKLDGTDPVEGQFS